MILRFDKKLDDWIQVPKEQRQESDLYMDSKLKLCLDHCKQEIKKDNDVVLIISGAEGTGKSTLMGHILEYISDTKFNPRTDLIGTDYLDGLEKIEQAERRGWLGFDEGNAFFLSTDTMTKQHRDLHKIFSIFRQKNLFVVICLPGFLRLGSYFALDRSKALIRTYIQKNEKGCFAFYGLEAKNKLYTLGKHEHNINVIKPGFRGRFTKCLKLENDEYRKFKRSTLRDEIAKAKAHHKKKETPGQTVIKRNIEIIEHNINLPTKQLSKLLGLSIRRINAIKLKFKRENAKK